MCFFTTKSQCENLFRSVMLRPPSRTCLDKWHKHIVCPYFLDEKKKLCDAIFAELRTKAAFAISIDVGFNSARNAQGATIAVFCDGQLIYSAVDVVRNA
jgi:hypothetical protein